MSGETQEEVKGIYYEKSAKRLCINTFDFTLVGHYKKSTTVKEILDDIHASLEGININRDDFFILNTKDLKPIPETAKLFIFEEANQNEYCMGIKFKAILLDPNTGQHKIFEEIYPTSKNFQVIMGKITSLSNNIKITAKHIPLTKLIIHNKIYETWNIFVGDDYVDVKLNDFYSFLKSYGTNIIELKYLKIKLDTKMRFRLDGVPPDQAIREIFFSPEMKIEDLNILIHIVYKLNPILAIRFIHKGKLLLPEYLPFKEVVNEIKDYDINEWAKKNIITVTAVKAGGCFLKETPVILANYNKKLIEELEVNDQILSYNYKKHEFTTSTISSLIKNISNNYIQINNSLRVTKQHPFFVIDKGWIQAEELIIGDKLFTSQGQKISISYLKRYNEPVDVYNLSVSYPHTFFAENVLVHNKNGREKKKEEIEYNLNMGLQYYSVMMEQRSYLFYVFFSHEELKIVDEEGKTVYKTKITIRTTKKDPPKIKLKVEGVGFRVHPFDGSVIVEKDDVNPPLMIFSILPIKTGERKKKIRKKKPERRFLHVYIEFEEKIINHTILSIIVQPKHYHLDLGPIHLDISKTTAMLISFISVLCATISVAFAFFSISSSSTLIDTLMTFSPGLASILFIIIYFITLGKGIYPLKKKWNSLLNFDKLSPILK